MTITEAVAYRLGGILKERGMKKKTLGKLPGVKSQSISNIFRSKSVAGISMTTLYRICRALDMSMSEFLNDPVFDNIELPNDEAEK
ncbi:MAG: helix-turn-helix transcriptional regulator [Clostridia bacterium]|nr:helix-turn-helix transcriptional regulator [Clostridia bacterium]